MNTSSNTACQLLCVQGSNFSAITTQLADDISDPAPLVGCLSAQGKSNHNNSQHRLSAGLVNNVNTYDDDDNN